VLLFADGSADFRTSPAHGVGQDNIYTRWSVSGGGTGSAGVLYSERVGGAQPEGPDAQSGSGSQSGNLAPYGNTDTFIYP
jgi:hypothetical protein